jgi:hypothetical protein
MPERCWSAAQVAQAERALLLAASRNQLPALQVVLASGHIDWSAFWECAQRQHVAPLVAWTLDHPVLKGVVPDDVRQVAKGIRLQTLLYNMAVHTELERIAELLSAQAIPVIPLKGTSLARRLFGDISARRCGDIDILVPEWQREVASLLLAQAGYEPIQAARPGVKRHMFHGVPLTRRASGVTFRVELHWGLSDSRFVTVDLDALWERVLAGHGPVGSETTLHLLPAEELLLFLALHLPKHDFALLRLLADIHHLVLQEGETIDWAYLVALAERWQADDLLYFALTAVSTILPTPLPGDVLSQLRPARWKRLAIERLTGVDVLLHPPTNERLRVSRFRIAYCLMLQPIGRSLHAYAHYILLPPIDQPRNVARVALSFLERPFAGIARTIVVVWTSCFARRRRLPLVSVDEA